MSAQLLDVVGNHYDADYAKFLARVQARFNANAGYGLAALFQTDAADLWGAYLNTFGAPPTEGQTANPERQYHTCHTCRHFVERFGGLVVVDETGQTVPAIWHENDAPPEYKPAIAAMARLVRRAKITHVFLSSEKVWGTPEAGGWHHLAITPPAAMVYSHPVFTAFQAYSAKTQDFQTVMHALNEFTQPHLELALTLLKTDALYRSEKVLGQAEWLHALHVARAAAHGQAKANVVWRAIATAPAGFCHPRSSMIGTLLEDIAAGKKFSEVSRAFAAKMHPLSYQRPQAAPTAGAIDEAEKLMQKLGLARSLERRFARLDEVQALWRPAANNPEPSAGGVFGHLKAKGATVPIMAVPAQTMTWEKFQREVLPTAEQIEFCAPSIGPYSSLVTAVHADAPPILQWDSDTARNPMSWYLWPYGSAAGNFGLIRQQFYKVNAIALKPSMWNGGHEHQGAGVMFVIDGAKDKSLPNSCLFPEILKSELHGVRSVIEAHSNSAKMQGAAEASAAGVMLTKGAKWEALLRVTVAGKAFDYKLDRWD